MFFYRFWIPNIEKLKKKRDFLGLLKALRHPRSVETRMAAVYALKKDERALMPLVDAALNDSSDSVRLAALEVLRGMTWPLHHQLEQSGAVAKQIAILNVLALLHDESAHQAVIKCLECENELVTAQALETLGVIGGAQAVLQLQAFCKNGKSDFLTKKAQSVLGRLTKQI